MKCERVQPILLDYARGLLSSREAEEVRAHLAECGECEEIYKEEVEFAGLLADMPAHTPARDMWQEIESRTTPRRTLADTFRPFFTGKAAIAVAAALIILFAVIVTNITSVTSPERPQEVAGVQYEVPVEAAEVSWSDDPLSARYEAMAKAIDEL